MVQHSMTTTPRRPTDSRDMGDGLVDMMIGIGLLFFGVTVMAGMPWMAGILPAIFAPIWVSLRRSRLAAQAADPDATLEHFEYRRQRAAVAVGAIALTVGIAFLVAMSTDVLSESVQLWLRTYFDPILGVTGAGFCVLGAYLTGARRYYLYGLAFAVIFGAIFLAGGTMITGLVVSGVFFMVCATIIMLGAIRD